MKSIETNILIKAPIEVLWKAFMLFSAYPDWNTVMTVSGEAELGNRLHVNVSLNGKASSFKPKVSLIEDERKFEWKGSWGHGRLFSGTHYFHFYPEGEGQTRFIHGERFSGIFSRAILKKIGKSTEEGFVAFNRALKEYAEDLVI
ncbi:SRPBCC domain-containing protein [Reichenbachiella agarivorans]|uniref:SRPBCC domain-containing protein n=1 Tax=Reichenbachiella agarivorans TaxID=2979464 RepID=A0ABY6CRD1_9BACT|nr:SRPBCC domain-containing protein [Reichenbachiella agarivorans]UXP33067.1 SRPBCC domain-containing protein [Reichenbachiella agarivorans]